jgi:hypothetical protein
MRLDHVSYVASHDQISDVVNRIGSRIGTAFVDGGIHPKFGTRNFTAPLLNGQYIEIVCPLDHPATDATPFGQAVKKKADAGGGWLTWVISVEDIKLAEKVLERNSVEGVRRKPDGTTLKWKQIGVLDVFAGLGIQLASGGGGHGHHTVSTTVSTTVSPSIKNKEESVKSRARSQSGGARKRN